MNQINFGELNDRLMVEISTLLREWYPNGKLLSNEWCIGDLTGSAGKSLKINTSTGKWCDFATGDKGGDLVSLYAKKNNINNGEAARELAKRYSIETSQQEKQSANKFQTFPPKDIKSRPSFPRDSIVYEYKSKNGHILFYVARFMVGGQKRFRPYTYFTNGSSADKHKGEWKPLGIRATSSIKRPLFGLEYLTEDKKDKPILIVEGEKAVIAARKFIDNNYIVLTWCGGANSVRKAEWGYIAGKNVLIWPDADKAGGDAADILVECLFHSAKEIKVINVKDIEKESQQENSKFKKGWDAADSGFKSYDEFKRWAMPRVEEIELDSNESPEDKEKTKKEAQALRIKYRELNLLSNQNGKIMCNETQVLRVLEGHQKFNEKIFFDEFKRKIFMGENEVDENIISEILIFIQGGLKIERISHSMVRRAVEYLAHKNKINSRMEWLHSLSWDGKERIQESMMVYFGAKDLGIKERYEYLQSVGKNFWISLAARGIKPGCKSDFMVILEGKQGIQKSVALEIIGGDGYRQPFCSIRKESEFISSLEGSTLVEIAEMDAFRGADVTRIKKVLSTSEDNIKKVYKDPKMQKRTFIMVGTTNDSEYLRDETGNRRFYPVEVLEINTDKLKRDLEQLYAESVHRYKDGESWWEFPKYAEEVQESKREEDIWTPYVQQYVNNPKVQSRGYVTINELFSFSTVDNDSGGAIPMSKDLLDNRKKMRVSKILRALGWTCKVEKIKGEGRTERRYRPPSQ